MTLKGFACNYFLVSSVFLTLHKNLIVLIGRSFHGSKIMVGLSIILLALSGLLLINRDNIKLLLSKKYILYVIYLVFFFISFFYSQRKSLFILENRSSIIYTLLFIPHLVCGKGYINIDKFLFFFGGVWGSLLFSETVLIISNNFSAETFSILWIGEIQENYSQLSFGILGHPTNTLTALGSIAIYLIVRHITENQPNKKFTFTLIPILIFISIILNKSIMIFTIFLAIISVIVLTMLKDKQRKRIIYFSIIPFITILILSPLPKRLYGYLTYNKYLLNNWFTLGQNCEVNLLPISTPSSFCDFGEIHILNSVSQSGLLLFSIWIIILITQPLQVFYKFKKTKNNKLLAPLYSLVFIILVSLHYSPISAWGVNTLFFLYSLNGLKSEKI